MSVKSGFHPSHRNFKQSALSVATDRFKPNQMKVATRFLISEAAESPDVSCLEGSVHIHGRSVEILFELTLWEVKTKEY